MESDGIVSLFGVFAKISDVTVISNVSDASYWFVNFRIVPDLISPFRLLFKGIFLFYRYSPTTTLLHDDKYLIFSDVNLPIFSP